MEPARIRPRAQLLVCTNARLAGDPLASACGAAGPAVYLALKHVVGAAGRVRDVWVTRTACLGHCPRAGCSVVLHPGNHHWVDVTAPDAPEILARALAALDAPPRDR